MTDEPTFEAAHAELAEIVRRLETGEASLDEALQLWRRGEELYRVCVELLAAAEGRVEELRTQVDDQAGTL